MKRKVWIWNHYGTKMFKDQAGRHYWFAENLVKLGAHPTIFCASTMHNSNESIPMGGQKYASDQLNGIPFVFVKTPEYKGNGRSRILNMITFYRNLFPVARQYAKRFGKPDVILASSVHPLTLIAGIKIAKKLGIPCICEIRDLWPETIVAYGALKRSSIIAKLLYLGEKWIYKKADALIFTMEGGKDYIVDKGWDQENGGPIDLNKVHHINNGVDLEMFDYNREFHTVEDEDLNNKETFKVIYTGSIGKANNVKKLVEAAEYIEFLGYQHIKLLIYGDGPEKEALEKYCQSKDLQNITFKGFVEKNKIPYILSKSNVNIMHFEQNSLKRYGASLNKMFEYFASGKPTISDCEFGYDQIQKYQCGMVVDNANVKQLSEAIIQFSQMSKAEYTLYCQNARIAAQDYDFTRLTEKLVDVLGVEKKEIQETYVGSNIDR
ncbi:glycosyltransferase family 4 protein [Niallia sp. Krafla_26]|uniref:glycosyltransferase family 4 protein n=1 Tax=Niallia sp. Krafla_26 TaxID=3064703 RepID=UPI003D16E4CA